MNSTRTIESYKGYEIEAIVVRLTDDIFTAYGYVRSTKMIRIGLPFEKSFKTGGQYSTVDAALKAGIRFARATIDDVYETYLRATDFPTGLEVGEIPK